MDYKWTTDENGHPRVETDLSDFALLTNPLLNKGMGFSQKERDEFYLHGLLPPEISTIEVQRLRSYNALKAKQSTLEKYIYLRDLQDSNETLYYNLLSQALEECLPIIYTPGVGDGCVHFSHIYRRPRGVFISYPCKDHIDQILSNPRFNQTEVIVVSDGERILGLGDQGAGGMGIPIGKLALYTVCAGIHPRATLPILLDTGTDNIDRLKDPLYIGWKHERLRGQEYDDFVDLFVQAVKKRFPHVLLQWEDFAKHNASSMLEKYRDQLCTFNDDIQGTAAIAVGTLLAAVQVAGTRLRDQRIVIVGAGSAGCGISALLLRAMVEDGLPENEARGHFYLLNRTGLITDQTKDLLPFQQPFVQPSEKITQWKRSSGNTISLLDIVKNVKPTLLIGVSAQAGVFTEEIVREMASHVEHPIIFPLSNPTVNSEAKPTDLIQWTRGKVIMGTGSPFGTVEKQGKPFRVDQTNNSYIFPGMGLGVIAIRAKRVTDSMFMAAARALAEESPAKKDKSANLLPPFTKIRDVSFKVARAVAKEAIERGLAEPCPPEEIERRIKKMMWTPTYVPYRKKNSR
jgi:malate dehydrogenase (oxaloacetate-decarboxylating)